MLRGYGRRAFSRQVGTNTTSDPFLPRLKAADRFSGTTSHALNDASVPSPSYSVYHGWNVETQMRGRHTL